MLHIVTDEAKVFVTKVNLTTLNVKFQERAPILLCIEVYRPEELLYLKKKLDKKEGSLISQKMKSN